LEQVCLYRKTGLALADVQRILDSHETSLTSVLERRLQELSDDITRLREQQHLIIGLLKNNDLFDKISVMNKNAWVALLAASGFTEEDMRRWHMEFERLSPEKHERFLRFLGIPPEEIEFIKSWASASPR